MFVASLSRIAKSSLPETQGNCPNFTTQETDRLPIGRRQHAFTLVRQCRRAVWRLAAGLLVFCVSSAAAIAQSTPPAYPSGSVSIHQVQVAFIGSGALGGGTLYYQGRAYPFRLGGLGIGGFGISRLDAVGGVYNLRRLTDFNGVYGQARTGWAIGQQGQGRMWLENPNGVYLSLRAEREGLTLSLGADGMLVRLGQ